ncbi:hypothetical protein ACTXI0_13000 [Arthrobacter rhombi]
MGSVIGEGPPAFDHVVQCRKDQILPGEDVVLTVAGCHPFIGQADDDRLEESLPGDAAAVLLRCRRKMPNESATCGRSSSISASRSCWGKRAIVFPTPSRSRPIGGRDSVQCLYTSGTTARPKGTLTSHVSVTIASLSNSSAVRENRGSNPSVMHMMILPMTTEPLERVDAMYPPAAVILGSGQMKVLPATALQWPAHQQNAPNSWVAQTPPVLVGMMDVTERGLSAGEVVEIAYRSPDVCSGYWQNPQAEESSKMPSLGFRPAEGDHHVRW